jgi:hypothetical protein
VKLDGTEHVVRAGDRFEVPGKHGILTATAAGPILLAHRDELRLPIPGPVQRVALSALTAAEKLRRR